MKNKEIKEAMDKIQVAFGKESVMLLGSKERINVDTISSGSLLINKSLGIGGYPKGRVIEIYGPESSGKTTLSLHAIAEVQKKGGICAFVDAEHAIDPQYAEALGVKIDDLILSQPDSGEQALEIVDILSKTGTIDLIIVDSVAALVPEAELNGEMKDQTIGAQARLMSKALRKITGSLSKNKTTIIFLNQIREKVGVMFGNPETTPGGRALKFYASIRMEIRRISSLGTTDNVTGNNVRIKVLKNKLAPPFKTTCTEIHFGKGISLESEIIQLAEEEGVLIRKGAWYKYNDKNIAQGKNNMRVLLEENKEFKDDLYAQLNKKISN
ncbi:recombinase RecA [Mycoplasma todarodis]|uniref:recombinase RecA n=1 Tax=Mycoplasma todarodis TaxID=1937191 RepID=UPI003B2CED61